MEVWALKHAGCVCTGSRGDSNRSRKSSRAVLQPGYVLSGLSPASARVANITRMQYACRGRDASPQGRGKSLSPDILDTIAIEHGDPKAFLSIVKIKSVWVRRIERFRRFPSDTRVLWRKNQSCVEGSLDSLVRSLN